MKRRVMFRFSDLIRLGLHGVIVHKVRSVLTVLGILFGVWGVIAMLAINAGLSEESQRALRQLGSTNIIIDATKPSSNSGQSGGRHGALNYGLTRADVERLKTNIPGVKQCAVMHKSKKNAVVGSKIISVAVAGVESNYASVSNPTVVAGRFLNEMDSSRRAPHCVMTSELARDLFAYQDPIGRAVMLTDIEQKPFLVVGLIEKLPHALQLQAGESGRCIIVPLSADRQRFGEVSVERSQGSRSFERVEISQCILEMEDEKAVLRAAPVVRELLERYHENRDYLVRIPVEEIRLKERDRRRWNFMFFMIASVSLLVGGIGIMNIMLASVTERTREIGVRRALGAKRKDIVVQFIVEAVTLTAIGGVLGIVIGLAVPWVVENTLQFSTKITPATLFVPFAMAVVVGLLSGLYPAMRAAKLDPIEALRHE